MPAFDEMFGVHDGPGHDPAFDAVLAPYKPIADWLAASPPELMAARQAQAELFFRRIGITFAV